MYFFNIREKHQNIYFLKNGMCSYQKKESILKFTTKNERRNIGKPQH